MILIGEEQTRERENEEREKQSEGVGKEKNLLRRLTELQTYGPNRKKLAHKSDSHSTI